MGIRLFVTDMDGTLIGRSYAIEPGSAACIRSLQASGVAFAVATGRIRRDAAAICSRAGLSPYVISNNGTCLFSPTGELLHGRPIPPDVLDDAMGFLEDEAICYGLGASEAFVAPSSWRTMLSDEVDRLARQGTRVPPDRIEHASSENAEQDGFTCVASPPSTW
jgi:hydroxymethylpyrimidine pyrophosphatase-like HAD family hydrolase